MLYYLLYQIHPDSSLFNVFRYITFRTFAAALTALALSLLFGGHFILWLKGKGIGQAIREEGPTRHMDKAGTPTMGGLLVLFSLVVSTLLWSDLNNPFVWFAVGIVILFGGIGFLDDFLKVYRKHNQGLPGRVKLTFQFLFAVMAGGLLYWIWDWNVMLNFPFFKSISLNLGWFYIPFVSLVMVGSSNAVNLTDGLDGLAIGPVITSSATYGILAYVAGHAKLAYYLQIPFVPGAGELTIFCAALACSCLGFLWYSSYPASVFLGDVGSLSLGAALGLVSIITRNEILLLLIGGIFVVEALSVISQVASYKMTHKRIFRMAPLHHHFELKGWAEPKIVVRFWIISIILALIALATLKLR